LFFYRREVRKKGKGRDRGKPKETEADASLKKPEMPLAKRRTLTGKCILPWEGGDKNKTLRYQKKEFSSLTQQRFNALII
jgi:hypothetical protein